MCLNDAFRGKTCTIYNKDYGKFLQLIEAVSVFDNPMDEYLRKIKNEEIHHHYLDPRFQTELINLIENNMRSQIITRISKAKYYSIILDAMLDLFH